MQRVLLADRYQKYENDKDKARAYVAQERIEHAVALGQWISTGQLEDGDVVRVDSEFKSSDESVQVTLPSGLMGVVESLDDDGDAQINFPSLGGVRSSTRWVIKANFKRLCAQKRKRQSVNTPGNLELMQAKGPLLDEEAAMPTT